MGKRKHIPVLLKEVVDVLNLDNGQIVVDGTLGIGGHAREIIKRIMPDGVFIGIDLDTDLFEITRSELMKEFGSYKDKLSFVHGNYANIREIIKELGIDKVDRILADIGFSSWHLSDSGRGFSFNSSEVLDMRYDTSIGIPAYEVLNAYSQKEIEDILLKYGEETYSKRIAEEIIKERQKEKIITADRLRELIHKVVPASYKRGKIDPSTKTFQALRIYVNQELDNLEKFLDNAIKILKKNGRVAIISFHSMEDRLVKHFFKNLEYIGAGKVITKKPIVPSEEEIKSNPRSRSAKLRVFEIN